MAQKKFKSKCPNIYYLVGLVKKHGGKIINAQELPPYLILQAMASNRLWEDKKTRTALVWEPPFAGEFPETPEEVELFEEFYPLEEPGIPEEELNQMIEKILSK